MSLRLKLAFILIIFSSVASCMRGGEVLAEYNGGTVTRREMRQLFEIFQGQNADAAASVEAQDQMIRTYALMKITAIEAKAEGLEKDPAVADQMMLLDEQALLTAFDIHLKRHSSGKKLRMFNLQFLILAGRGAEGTAARRAEGQDLLARLNVPGLSDEEIEKLITAKTENPRYKAIGGYIDPHCVSCQPNPLGYLTDPLMNEPLRKFVLIENQQGLWIIRKVEDFESAPDDLESAFEAYHRKTQRLARNYLTTQDAQGQGKDFFQSLVKSEQEIETMAKQQAKHWADMTAGTLTQNRLEELKKSKKLELKPEATPAHAEPLAAQYQDSTVLYVMDGKPFTYGELKKRTPVSATIGQRLQMLTAVIIPFELIKDESEAKEAKQSDIYTFYRELTGYESLTRAYLMKRNTDPQIGEDKIMQMYELRKLTQYAGQSYASVRSAILEQLKAEARQKIAQETQQKLIEKYSLKIEREALKPGKL